MEWFYANKSDQQVAFEETNFKALVKSGSIKEDTLVWNEELPDWKPCRDVRPEMFAITPSSDSPDLPNTTEPPLLPPPAVDADSTDGIAITSLVFGILSLLGVPFAGFVAIICGHLSRKKLIERTGSTEGGGVSMAGLVLGYIGILLGLAITLIFVALVIIGANSPT